MKALLITLATLAVTAAAAADVGAAGGGPSPGTVSGWDGVRAPGGAVRFVALPSGAGVTTVAAVRVRGGRILRFASVPGALGIPQVAFDGTADGVSADGRRLVLASIAGAPAPGARTTFAVMSARTLRVERRITLPGTWSFDALSPDGATIYAIEYATAANPSRYRVRAIDAETGRVLPGAIVDRRDPNADMRGSPVTRVSAAGTAYTLYLRPNGTAFVHALDTRRRSARCIDLPWRDVGKAVWGVRLTVAGGVLRLRQPGVGRLASVDLRGLTVRAFRAPVAPGSPVS